MRKSLWTLGILAGMVSSLAFLVGCLPAATGTTDTTTTGSSTSSFLILIGFIVVLFVLMYFLTIRPQRKRQQQQVQMIQELQRGDKIVTIGGMMGNIESVTEDSVVIRTESGATLRFVKSAIATKVQPQTQESAPK